MRQWAKRASLSSGTPAFRAAATSYGSSGPPARAAPVAKPPWSTSRVTQAGRSRTGVREPTFSVPAAMPASTRRQPPARASARARVAGSVWVSAVTKARARCPSA